MIIYVIYLYHSSWCFVQQPKKSLENSQNMLTSQHTSGSMLRADAPPTDRGDRWLVSLYQLSLNCGRISNPKWPLTVLVNSFSKKLQAMLTLTHLFWIWFAYQVCQVCSQARCKFSHCNSRFAAGYCLAPSGMTRLCAKTGWRELPQHHHFLCKVSYTSTSQAPVSLEKAGDLPRKTLHFSTFACVLYQWCQRCQTRQALLTDTAPSRVSGFLWRSNLWPFAKDCGRNPDEWQPVFGNKNQRFPWWNEILC